MSDHDKAFLMSIPAQLEYSEPVIIAGFAFLAILAGAAIGLCKDAEPWTNRLVQS